MKGMVTIMKYTHLGRTSMKVSRLVLGTGAFGIAISEKDCHRLLDCAVDHGINLVDTANVYGTNPFSPTDGISGHAEQIIGSWFGLGGGRRERMSVATKVGHPMMDPLDGPNDDQGVNAFKIRRHFEASLRRLNTDYVDIYQLHHIDSRMVWSEIWGVLESLVNKGDIYYIGSSNFGARHLVKAQMEAEKRNFFGLVSEQHRYNLMHRLPELEVLPAAEELGLTVMCYCANESGFLAGGARKQRAIGGKTPEELERLYQYEDLCAEAGLKPGHVSLAWIMRNARTCPVVGPKTPEQLEDLVKACEIKLTDDFLQKLDEIFPGPKGSYPAAYCSNPVQEELMKSMRK